MMQDPSRFARVNATFMGSHPGTNVRMLGVVKDVQDSQFVIQTTDNVMITVLRRQGPPTVCNPGEWVEVAGRPRADGRLQEDDTFPVAGKPDVEVWEKIVQLSHKYSDLFNL